MLVTVGVVIAIVGVAAAEIVVPVIVLVGVAAVVVLVIVGLAVGLVFEVGLAKKAPGFAVQC